MDRVEFSRRLLALLPDVPATSTDLFDEGYVDSMGLVDLIMKIEQEFGVRISLADLEIDAFRSVDSITAFLEAA